MNQTADVENQESALGEVQKLQFADRLAANKKLIEIFAALLPFKLASAEIIPRAFSLNSISGSLLSITGETFFFKTHVEPDSILQEYYNVSILEEAGYPIIKPLFVEETPGQQIVVYPFIKSRTVFDILSDAEGGDSNLDSLLQAQVDSDKQLLAIYRSTYQLNLPSTESPVHQLFYHRLAGRRFRDFYEDSTFEVGDGTLSFVELAACKWEINSIEYKFSLAELIQQALILLEPDKSWGRTVIGHGDAHNGNLFFDEAQRELMYFDPAFAGRHSPFLDIIKPLFHNVFATWMYHPAAVASTLALSCEIKQGVIKVKHDYRPSEFRHKVLNSKIEHVLRPLLIEEMDGSQRLMTIARMRAALLCCPLLTVNLADNSKYLPEIAILGLSQCIELASLAAQGLGRFDFIFSVDESDNSGSQT